MRKEQIEKNLERMEEYERVIWEINVEEGDPIKRELDEIISGIEEKCNPILQRK